VGVKSSQTVHQSLELNAVNSPFVIKIPGAWAASTKTAALVIKSAPIPKKFPFTVPVSLFTKWYPTEYPKANVLKKYSQSDLAIVKATPWDN